MSQKPATVTVLVLVLALSAVVSPVARGQDLDIPHCQILDVLSDPLYEVGLTVIPNSRYRGHGSSASFELDGQWEVAYFRNVLGGDVDAALRGRTTVFFDSAGLDLPDQLLRLAIDAGWTRRLPTGVSFQARVQPGLYTDIEKVDGDAVSLPFSLSVIRSFNPGLSGILGLSIRPGFDLVVMPLLGLEWEAAETLRVEAGLPSSRITWFAFDRVMTYAGLDWDNTTYYVEDGRQYARDEMTVEDFRLYWGLTWRLSDQLHLSGELGEVFARNVEFDGRGAIPDDSADVEDRAYVRLAVLGPF